MSNKVSPNKKFFSPWHVVLLGLILLIAACGAQKGDSLPQNGPQQTNERELLVSAAASLQEVLAVLEKDYTRQQPGVKIIYNFGSSGTLQRQIEQGAPVDLFISAGKSQMDELEKKNLLLPGTRRDLLGNELVLVAAKENNAITKLQDLTQASVAKIGVGTPETVPAGKYAQEALVNLQMWDLFQDKLILAKDVKQVLTYVETGNVDAGFVYRSDAAGSERVKVIEALPPESHSPIVYPAAIIGESKNQETASDFLEYLQKNSVQQIFKKFGFQAIP